MKIYCLAFAVIIANNSFANNKIKIGIWERYDTTAIKKSALLTNSQEIIDGKDNDNNGFVDDIYGIGFDKYENLIPESFIANTSNYPNYDHGTAVADILLSHNNNVVITGVGFEYTSQRLQDSGLLKLSVAQRLKQLPQEFAKMDYFVSQSIAYFKQQQVKIVNISWGLILYRVVMGNLNLGNNLDERTTNARKWLTHFQHILTQAFSNNPDILFIVSSGNNGLDVTKNLDVPANIKLDNVIVVGGLDITKTSPAYFSNFGKNVDIYAPSVGIKYHGALGKVDYANGVSFAVPYVVAICAKLISAGKIVTKQNIKQLYASVNH